MAIQIFPNKISFGTFELEITSTGIGTNSEINSTRSKGNFVARDFLNLTPSDTFQGTVAGFSVGGEGPIPPSGNTYLTRIDRFPFASDTNSSAVGNIAAGLNWGVGHSSETHGYNSGGSRAPGSPPQPVHEKYSFSTYAPTAVGTSYDYSGPYAPGGGGFRVQFSNGTTGLSSQTHGYVSGGAPPGLGINGIVKFPFAVDENGTLVGKQIIVSSYFRAGISAFYNGYFAGGNYDTGGSTAATNRIEKINFARDTSSQTTSKLTRTGLSLVGTASPSHGYTSGGSYAGVVIDKFSFATESEATDVGDLTQGRVQGTPAASTTHGYHSGGYAASPPGGNVKTNVIDKFPFATDSNASDVGDLSMGRRNFTSGSQD